MYIKADSGNYVARLFYVPVWGLYGDRYLRPQGDRHLSPLRPQGDRHLRPHRGENWGLTWSELQVIYSVQDKSLL